MALVGREKSMGFVWFLIASILVGVLIWTVYDEDMGRRTWKHYAAQWEELETKRLTAAIKDAQKAIDPAVIKKIHLDREKAAVILESSEFQKAQAIADQKKKDLDDASQVLQFSKADQDEVFYEWKHSVHEGETGTEIKKHYDELESQVQKLKAIQDQKEEEFNTAQAKVKEMQDKVGELDAQEKNIYKKIDLLKKQLDAAHDRGAPIEQYVLPQLGINGAVIWGNVDRCTSCHINTLKTGYEKEKEPFRTHPQLKEIFSAHPVEKYGCVTCHGGQGRATQILGKPLEEGDYAHGFEHHWLNPLLRGDFVQSTCNKCHLQQWKVDMAPVYTQGKQIFVNYGCVGCHKIQGMEWAPKAGPDLAKVKDKVYPEWMFAWVKKPTSYLPHTKMPQPPWANDTEIIQTMSYLLSVSEPFNWKYGKFPGGNAEAGKDTFNKVGCIACHSIEEKGGTLGPALDRVAEKTNSDWIYNWIQEPKNWSHVARMPSLRLSKEEAANVTAYLSSKGKKPDEDAKLRAALNDPANIKEGFRLVNTYGCYGCHNIKGFEKMSNPSVELTNFGRKDVSELAFGDAKIPQTWDAWTDGKLKNPQMYLDERSSSFMPKPNITDEQRHALLVFLKGQKPEKLPDQYIAYDPVIEAGRHMVNRYNCKACHLIEGEGQDIAKWITEPNFLPPNLASTGARLQTEWMFGFLHNPGDFPKVRSWLDIRMPTFGFTDEELDTLVLYFKKLSKVDTILEEEPIHHISPEYYAAAEKLTGPNNFNCATCHIVGNKFPAAGPTVWAPNLEYVHVRIRPQWLNKWIRNPGDLIPGARMPGYYSEPGVGPKDILGGDDEKQIDDIVQYLMTLGVPGAVSGGSEPAAVSAESKPADAKPAPAVEKPKEELKAPAKAPAPEAPKPVTEKPSKPGT